MKKVRQVFVGIVAAVLLLMSFSLTAWADSAWEYSWVEQYSTIVPEIKVYLYPTDKNGSLIYGMTANTEDIYASLDGEELEVVSFGSAKEEDTEYIFLLNLTSNGTGYEYLREIKKELCTWIDSLNDNDKFILITYADSVTLQLDGSENRSAAKRIVENLEVVVKDADTVSAVKEAIRIGKKDGQDEAGRKVLVMYDNGVFLNSGDMGCRELQSALIEADLPLYAFCNYPYSTLQDKMTEFTVPTGGGTVKSSADTVHEDSANMRSWLDSCYVLEMRCETNEVQPTERELEVIFGDSSGTENIKGYIRIMGSTPDNEAPRIEELSCEGTELTVRFSEKVRGADNAANYTVTGPKGQTLAISELSYDEDLITAVLTVEEEFKPGTHKLQLSGIRDISAEANPLMYPEGEDSYEFSTGDTAFGSVKIVALGITAAIIIIVAVIIIVLKRKNAGQQEEQQEIRPPEQQKLNAVLSIVLPTGVESSTNISVGDKFTVGRVSSRCDMAINDKQISGLHMILSYTNGKLIVADAGSTNGTFVNGERVEKQRQLLSGDTILIGKTKITVRY